MKLYLKIVVSLFFGLALTGLAWCYMNSSYTLAEEDKLYEKEVFLKDRLLHSTPLNRKEFVFINTGGDLQFVGDTASSGRVAVTDRHKLFHLLQLIGRAKNKPLYTLLNVKFDFPGDAADDSLQREISRTPNLLLAAFYQHKRLQVPIFKAHYGLSYYETYGSGINKLQLCYPKIGTYSIPCMMYCDLDHAVFRPGRFFTFCDGRLCFNNLWPDYFYDTKDAQTLSLGDILSDDSLHHDFESITAGKIIMVGDLNKTRETPFGDVAATVIIADTYLSLLNFRHFVPLSWLALMTVLFSALTYLSVFSALEVPALKLHFLFSQQVGSFLGKYISYSSILFVFSLLSVSLFNINISLLFPATIFSAVATIKQFKKS